MSQDRCLVRLEELTLENEILLKENESLKKVLVNIKNENKEYRDTIYRLKSEIKKWAQTKEDQGGNYGE